MVFILCLSFFLLAIVLSVLRFTDSDYPLGPGYLQTLLQLYSGGQLLVEETEVPRENHKPVGSR